jgi:hypothetical protein
MGVVMEREGCVDDEMRGAQIKIMKRAAYVSWLGRVLHADRHMGKMFHSF